MRLAHTYYILFSYKMYRNCSLHAPFKLSMFAGILLLYPAYSATQVKATHLKSELMPALVSFESLILERLLFAETLEASELAAERGHTQRQI